MKLRANFMTLGTEV